MGLSLERALRRVLFTPSCTVQGNIKPPFNNLEVILVDREPEKRKIHPDNHRVSPRIRMLQEMFES